MGIKCFFLSPLDVHEYSLRRFTYSQGSTSNRKGCSPCSDKDCGHEARVSLGCYAVSDAPSFVLYEGQPTTGNLWPHDDYRWPKTCTKCGYTFHEEDQWQLFIDKVFERSDTKEQMTLRAAPVGAMYFADWYPFEDGKESMSVDGHHLMVKLPDEHYWSPEFRASNCDSPCKHCKRIYHEHKNKEGQFSGRCQPDWKYNDGKSHYEDSRPHFCWVRHGSPPTQIVHVDKAGTTCGAGAGSIAIPGWHGFLHNGELTT